MGARSEILSSSNEYKNLVINQKVGRRLASSLSNFGFAYNQLSIVK